MIYPIVFFIIFFNLQYSTINYKHLRNVIGPCGIENGIKIDCHGVGISCVDGNCLNQNHLISDAGEDCEYTKNCKVGLLCSSGMCIEPFSLPESKICGGKNECQKGLECVSTEPWGTNLEQSQHENNCIAFRQS